MSEIRKTILISKRKMKLGNNPTSLIVELSTFIDIFTLCRETNTLPRPGGLLDQDSLYVHLMRHALICQDERRQLDEAKSKQGS